MEFKFRLKPNLLILLLASITSFPALAMFCPTNFNQIKVGETLEDVLNACGKPYHVHTTESDDNLPQAWSYFVSPANAGQTIPNSGNASVKMDVTFANGRVVNITSNAMSLASTTICGAPISVGDTYESVKSACGKPPFINKGQPTPSTQPAIKITELTYGTSPAVILVFENGKFKGRK